MRLQLGKMKLFVSELTELVDIGPVQLLRGNGGIFIRQHSQEAGAMSVILFFCCFLCCYTIYLLLSIYIGNQDIDPKEVSVEFGINFFSVVVFNLSIETSKMPLGNQYRTPLKPYFSAVFYSAQKLGEGKQDVNATFGLNLIFSVVFYSR